MSMQICGFPVCCGAYIIGAFGYDTGMISQIDPKNCPDADKARMKTYILYNLKQYNMMGMFVIILNSIQIKYGIEGVVLDCGFKKVFGPCYHPGHGREIALYAYEVQPKAKQDWTQTKSPEIQIVRAKTGRFAKTTYTA